MRIIIANKYYYLDGGPERYMFGLTEHLESLGHQVIPFSMAYEGNRESKYSRYFIEPAGGGAATKLAGLEGGVTTKLKIAARSIYSLQAKRALERLIEDTKPDLIYCLNIVNHMSPSLIAAAKGHRIPIILRLSDYNMVCPSYLFLRDGELCTDCRKGYYKAIGGRCVQGSLSATACRVFGMYVHDVMRIYRHVSAFVTPTDFMRDVLVQHGIPVGKIHRIKTFVDLSGWQPRYDNDGYILYFGRLSREKGVEFLLESTAKSSTGEPLLIVGDSPDGYADELRLLGQRLLGDRVKFLGKKAGEELQRLVQGAKYVVVPSLWYDNAPNVVYESFSAGKAVIGTALGGLREQVTSGTGILVPPGDVDALSAAMTRLSSDDKIANTMGRNARSLVESEHSVEAHVSQLMALFDGITKS